MPVRFEHVETVAVSPERAFAAIDDLPLTAKWLPPCISLSKVGDGPNQVGDQLQYVFKEGFGQKEMAGEILDRIPGERLYCKYTDPAFDVFVDMRVAPAPEGAATIHTIEIIPKKILGKLFQPMIRMGIKKQTRTAAANLKRLLETPAE